jgi:hypothetical protein
VAGLLAGFAATAWKAEGMREWGAAALLSVAFGQILSYWAARLSVLQALPTALAMGTVLFLTHLLLPGSEAGPLPASLPGAIAFLPAATLLLLALFRARLGAWADRPWVGALRVRAMAGFPTILKEI